MNPEPMSQQELLTLIGGISLVVIAFTSVMFVVFSKFLRKEKTRGESFRSVHRKD